MRRNLPLFCQVFLGAIFACCLFCDPNVSFAQSPVEEASASLRKRDFAEALRQTQAALSGAPRDPKLWTLQGVAHRGLNQPQQALADFQNALKFSPNYIPALEGAAQIEYQADAKDAPALLKRLLALQPANETAHAMFAVLLYKKHRCPEAIDHFHAALGVISSQPDALTEYGICLVRAQRYGDAAPVFGKVLEAQPENPGYRYNFAFCQWKAGQGPSAMQTLQPALDGDAHANNASLWMLAADISESEHNTPRAVELLRKAILSHPQDPEPYLQFATLSYNHNSYQAGISMLDAGLTQLPNNDRLHVARGVLYVQIADYAHAMEDFETAERLNPTQSSAEAAEGLAQMQQHDESAAIQKFRMQVKAHPDQALGYLFLAEALAQQGNPEGTPEYKERLEAAQRAVKLDPQMAAAHDLLANIYLESGQTDLAIRHCNSALAIDPSDQAALYHLILATRKTDRKDQVPELLKRLASLKRAAQEEQSKRVDYRLMAQPQESVKSER